MSNYHDLGVTGFDPDLRLPINGKVYVIPAPNALDGLRLRELVRSEVLDTDDEIDALNTLLAPVLEQMTADGVSYTAYLHAGRTALLHYGAGARIALAYWQFGPIGHAAADAAPANTARRSPAKTKRRKR